jgi:signal transduction histidine kinase
MKYWNRYTSLIYRNCSSAASALKDLSYWRNKLFASTIIFLLPFCLIALLPGLYMIIATGNPILAAADIITITLITVVGFMPGISLQVRKIIFISCIYILSCILMYFLGPHGSGLSYLLAGGILSTLVFNSRYTFWPVWLNTCICICFGAAKFFYLVPWPHDRDNSLDAWIAVSSSIIFLSLLSAALLTGVFNGLQETIVNEKQLKEELANQQYSLEQALSMLQLKNDELEQFAFVASHDLKEPVRMVTSFMGLLKRKYGDQLDEKAHIYIDFAIDGGLRMQKMISDLLELSRTARQDAVRELVDLNDTLKEAKQNIFKLIEESHAEIITKTPLPIISSNKADITRLVQNLLINAIKFRKKEISPVIYLQATENQREWLFSMEDNGIGIDQEKLEKIFEVFARLHSHEDYEGTGIGLAVCKKVVEHYGGRIWAESENGTGSNFYFTINK